MANPLTLISYNTQFCTGRDGVTDVARIAREIESGDIVALQEIDRFWARTGNEDQAAELGRLMPERYWVYGPGVDLDASTQGEDGRVINRRRQFGNMVLSRWPILFSRNHLLPKLHLTGPLSLQRSALEAVIDTPGGPLRVFSIHLAHAAASERILQIERLLELTRSGATDGGAWSGRRYDDSWGLDGPPVSVPQPAILLGDFNMTPGSPEYVRICGDTDPVYGPLFTEDGFADAWIAGPSDGEGITFEKRQGGDRLDYAFLTGELAARVEAVWVESAAKGSDHLPLHLRIGRWR